MYLKQNYSVLWTFSDDYAACSGDCTYTAEYQALEESAWEPLEVDLDLTSDSYASFILPVMSLTNATTYAVRFTVTDCANQSTQSGTYYFRVAQGVDAPPVIGDGPFVAAGAWPILPGGGNPRRLLY